MKIREWHNLCDYCGELLILKRSKKPNVTYPIKCKHCGSNFKGGLLSIWRLWKHGKQIDWAGCA